MYDRVQKSPSTYEDSFENWKNWFTLPKFEIKKKVCTTSVMTTENV